MRFTHDAQVMPSIGTWISMVAGAPAPSVVILQGSIAAECRRTGDEVGTLDPCRPSRSRW